MRTLIAYSSRTGNTKSVARAILPVLPGPTLVSVQEAMALDLDRFDFVAIGFWVDKGRPDADARAFMEKVSGKKVGLFATLGAWPDSDHAKACMARACEMMAGNRVLGHFICQGKIDPEILAIMAARADRHHPMTEERRARIEEAGKHPNEEDFQNARDAFSNIAAALEEETV